MKEGFEGVQADGLDNLDEKQQAEMENIWATLEQYDAHDAAIPAPSPVTGKDVNPEADYTNPYSFVGEKNVRVDAKGVEHERTDSDFDLYPRQKGEAAGDYGVRLKWQHEAQRIMDETPREENESLEDYNARVKKMIPSLQEYRDSQNQSKWSTLDDKEKRALHDKYPRKPGESTNDWAKRIEAAEGGAVFSHGHNQFAEQLKTVQEQNEKNEADNKMESLKDTLASMRESADKIDKLASDYAKVVENLKRRSEELKAKRAEITPLTPDNVDAKPAEDKPDVEPIVDAKIDNNEDNEAKEAQRKETLRFIRSRKAVGFYAELGIKASDIESYSDEDLAGLKQQIEAKLAENDNKIEELSDEERIAKNRRDLRSRKYAKYLKAAGVDPRNIDSMSDEELALSLGAIEIAYEKDMKAQAEEERRKAEAEAEAKKPKMQTVEIGGFETLEDARKALRRIGAAGIVAAGLGANPANIQKAMENAAQSEQSKVTPIESGNSYDQGRVDELNKQLEFYKRQIWDANHRLQNTKGFFKRRKVAKDIDALSAKLKQTEQELTTELAKRQAPTPTNHQLDSQYRSQYYDNRAA